MAAGIVECRSRDGFHRLMKIVTGNEYDIVGFYYFSTRLRKINVILYDVYTGQMLAKSSRSMDDLRGDSSIEKISMRPFLGLQDNIRIAIGKLISNRVIDLPDTVERDIMKKNISHAIMKGVGLTTDVIPHTGYNIVNQVIMAVTGRDYSQMKHMVSSSSIDSLYLGVPTFHENQKGTTPKMSDHRTMEIFFDVCRELMLTNPTFETRVLSMANLRDVIVEEQIVFTASIPSNEPEELTAPSPSLATTPSPSPKVHEPRLVVNETPVVIRSRKQVWLKGDYTQDEVVATLLDQQSRLLEAVISMDQNTINGITAEINSFRREICKEETKAFTSLVSLKQARQSIFDIQEQIHSIVRDMDSGAPAIVPIGTLISNVDLVAKSLNIEKTDDSHTRLVEGSYPAILTTTSTIDQSVKISLKSGDSIILTSMNTNLDHMDTDTLREVIRYLDALDGQEKRFNTLKMIVTKELAIRRKI